MLAEGANIDSRSLSPLCAVVLAAGRSERFGSPKSLLRWGRASLVAHQVHTLLESAHIGEVLVVTGYGEPDVRAALHGLPVRLVHNHVYASGRATSVACGARAVGTGCSGLLLASVDQPLHRRALGDLVTSWLDQPTDIVRPLCAGRHGHPVIFPSDLREELTEVNDPGGGPRALLRRHPQRVRDIPTTYAQGLLNLNTREAYTAAIVAHAPAGTDEDREPTP